MLKEFKELKPRKMLMPEHFKKCFACFIDHQIILHGVIQQKRSWGEVGGSFIDTASISAD